MLEPCLTTDLPPEQGCVALEARGGDPACSPERERIKKGRGERRSDRGQRAEGPAALRGFVGACPSAWQAQKKHCFAWLASATR